MLKWRGAEVAARAEAAAKLAIDKTMARCVDEAKTDHPWENRTGTLEGSLRIVDAAAEDGARVVGRWGSADVNYAIYLETGTVHMEPKPYLRPAADRQYPYLRLRIRAAYAGEELL